MNILFIISSLFLIVAFMLIKKNDSKENIIKWIMLSVLLYFSLNIIVVFLLSLINVSAYQWLRSIIYILIAFGLLVLLLKKKKIQKYYFKWQDLIALILIVICTVHISNLRNKNGALYFETTDPSVHFALAQRFYENPTLTMDMDDSLFYQSNSFDLFASYTTLGTVFEIFDQNSSIVNLKIFIYFEVVILGISAYMLYLTLVQEKTKNISRILMLVLSLTYIILYPLNNMIFGFHYLGMCVLLINSIIVLFEDYFESKKSNKVLYFILLGILNFVVFPMYYLFVPIVYGGEGLYLLFKWLLKKEINFKEFAKFVGFTLLIPFIIGMIIFFVYPRFIPSDGPSINPFMLEGYIYRNLLGNFIILIPFVVYIMINNIREKKLDVTSYMIAILFVFMLVVFLWIYFGEAATYYYYKFYYVLSLLTTILIGKELRNKFNITFVLVVFILILSLLQIFKVEEKIAKKEMYLNLINSVNSVENILEFNQAIIDLREPVYTSDQLNSLKELESVLKDNNIKDGEIILYDDLLQKLWFYSLFEISPVYSYTELADYYNDNPSVKDVIKESRIKYVLVHVNFDEKELLDKNLKVLYKNNNYILYQR